MQLIPGATLGRYTILAPLGAGGMGEVFRARDSRLGREVAIKSLPAEKTYSLEGRQRLLREARAVAALNHPHIVSIYDVIEDGERLFVVMELVSGTPLDNVVRGKPLDWKKALAYAIDIAAAIETAHGAGIIHRDLKPGNVMLDGNGHAKLLDFGLAKFFEESASGPEDATKTVGDDAVTEEGAVVGTLSYLSPEQAQGAKADMRSDIFSFGLVLYEMLTGTRAFRGENRISTITSILRDDPKPVSESAPDAPRELGRIVERCLRKDPARRFQTAADLRATLEDLKDESESGLRKPPAAPARKIPWVPILSIVAVAALLLAGYAWLRPRRAARVAMVIRQIDLGGLVPQATNLSPDGKMITFTAVAQDSNNGVAELFVKIIDSGVPLRLTHSAELESGPIWSRDSARIFFSRKPPGAGNPDSTVWVVPALGGEEKQVTRGVLSDVSPDGRRLLVARSSELGALGGMFLVDGTGTSEQRVTTWDKGRIEFSGGRFSARGDAVFSVVRQGDQEPVLMRRPLGVGESSAEQPVPIRGFRVGFFVAALRDPEQLVVGGRTAEGEGPFFATVPPEGGEAQRLPNVLSGAGASFTADGKRMVYSRRTTEWQLWKAAVAGKTVEPPSPIGPRSTWYSTPAVSPDGGRLAVSATGETGSFEIEVIDLVSGRAKPLVGSRSAFQAGSPNWSPDGTKIAFDGRRSGNPDIWIISALDGEARQLTSEPSEDVVPAWAPDGTSILFTSNRTGRTELWRMPVDGGAARQVTHNGGVNGRYSPDARWIYFMRSRPGGELWRMPAGGGAEELVAPEVKNRDWVVQRDGVLYFATPSLASAPAVWRFFRFASRRWEASGAETQRVVNAQGIGLSPDGHWVYYSQLESSRTELTLVEGLR